MQSDVTSGIDVKTLEALNADYIRAVQASDVRWFERALAADFRCTLPDNSIIDRTRFLERAARPTDITDLEAHDVEVRVFGDAAIVHARTTFAMADGRKGAGRYTDVWVRNGNRWTVVAAHFTRSVE